MTEEQLHTHKPHFIIDSTIGNETASKLSAFEEAIYRDPTAVNHAAHLASKGELTPDHPYASPINMATSREIGLEFDDLTEEAIAQSSIIKELRIKRKNNQQHEERSLQLAAEVRQARLRLFIEKVIDYSAEHPLPTKPVLPDPELAEPIVMDSDVVVVVEHDISGGQTDEQVADVLPIAGRKKRTIRRKREISA